MTNWKDPTSATKQVPHENAAAVLSKLVSVRKRLPGAWPDGVVGVADFFKRGSAMCCGRVLFSLFLLSFFGTISI